ncbi:MAG: 50S ribosomal protein L24 [Bacteroidetes bacterium]|jgi:large subunit ribosomal protein L24|nr:MAG: 50S ribosomal protein L24 [Bacteroidota bacterium]
MERKKNKQPKLHVKSGDMVLVIAGDEKGNTGKVLEIDMEKRRAIVEGLNMAKRHRKPTAQSPEGGIVQFEAPIHISNLMVIDPATGLPARIGRKLNAKGKLERYFKKTKYEKVS